MLYVRAQRRLFFVRVPSVKEDQYFCDILLEMSEYVTRTDAK